MSFTLYLDENMDPELAQRLRVNRVDVETAAEAGLSGSSQPDEVQLAHACTTGRALLTHDLDTVPAAAQRLLDTGGHHPGVVLCPRQPAAVLYRRVLRLLAEFDADNLRDAVIWLPPDPE